VAPATSVPAAVGGTVQMVDNEPDLTNWHFDPADLTVAVGSTVTWHNAGNQEHSVTADDGSFDSGLTEPGSNFERAFPKVGVYAYHCRPHPWMKARIHVVSAAAVASSATTATTGAPTTTTTASPTTTAGAGGAASPSTTAAAGATGGGTGTTSASGSAAPAGSHHRSGGHLAGTIALVLGLTLAGLAVGARLSRSRA